MPPYVSTSTSPRTFTIGRSPECDLVLADDSVSRRHAELLVLDHGQLFLVDCQSTHGTRLTRRGQMRQVQQEFVEPDAVVSFGDVSLSVGELIEALRAKHPDAALPAHAGAAAAAPAPVRHGRTWDRGTRLVRCPCGVVKPKSQRCPECGE
jgi:predicted component of type VI protein secretion system